MRFTGKQRIAALTGLSLALVAACGGRDGGDESGAESPQELVVITAAGAGTPGGTFYREIFDEFTERTGIEVRVNVAAEDLATAFEASFAAGEEADIVHVNPVDRPLTWLDSGAVVPVTEYLDEWDLADRLAEGALKQWTRDDGQVLGFPYEGFQWPVWYNTAILEQAGVTEIPETTEDLIEAAGKLRDAGFQPFAIGGNDWSGEKLFFQFAQSFTSEEDAIELFAGGGWCDNSDGMKGIELFTELRDAEVFQDDAQGLDAQSMGAAFNTGQAAIMSAGSWSFPQAPEEMIDDVELSGLPIPDGATYDKPTAFEGTSNGFWISRNGEEKIDEVRQLIELLYEPETVARFISATNTTVALTTPEDTVTETHPLLQQALTELPDRVEYAVLPDSYIPGNISASVIRATALAFTPGRSAQDICTDLDETYRG